MSWDKVLLALGLSLVPALAAAQSNPGFVSGQILPAEQLNNAFAAKTDYPPQPFNQWFQTPLGDINYSTALGTSGAYYLGANKTKLSGMTPLLPTPINNNLRYIGPIQLFLEDRVDTVTNFTTGDTCCITSYVNVESELYTGWAGTKFGIGARVQNLGAPVYPVAPHPLASGNYQIVGGSMIARSAANMGGTGTTASPLGIPAWRGSLFGVNPVAVANLNATQLLVLAGDETDVALANSATAAGKVGKLIQLGVGDQTRGTIADSAIAIGKILASDIGTWHHGLVFGGETNTWAMAPDSTLIAGVKNVTSGAALPAKYGIDFADVTFSNNTEFPAASGTFHYGAPLRVPFMTPGSTDTCAIGALKWDADYSYVCTSANVWKRSPLARFDTTYTIYGAGVSTHTFQTSTTSVRVVGCGPGGGGGSGARQTSGSAASGGSGGGGGGCFDKLFKKSELGTSMNVRVGTGGTGGADPGGHGAGNPGNAGSSATCISTTDSGSACTGTIYAVGGFGGAGAGGQLAAASASGGGGCSYLATITGSGTNTTNGASGSGSTPGNPCFFGTAGVAGALGTSTITAGMGGAGGGGNNGAQGPIGSSMLTGASGGGAGGGIIAAGPSSAAGGNGGYVSTAAAAAATGGAAGNNNGSVGTTPVSACMGATGGGGGGGNHAGNAGSGGNGTKGSGGGGGGSSLDANTAGAGGNGGNGFVCVYEFP